MIAAAKNYILLVTDRMNLTGVIITLGRQLKKRIILCYFYVKPGGQILVVASYALCGFSFY